jgi:hypothetical protein
MKSIFLLLTIVVFSFSSFANPAPIETLSGKPFKRALIIGGGGIQPALGLGILAAAEEQGWKPDVIIATCGASLPSAIYDKFNNAYDGLEYMKSNSFFETLSKIKIDNGNLLSIQQKFKNLERYPNVIPDFFKNNALYIPEFLNSALTNDYFKSGPNKPRIIVLSSRAHFKREDVGKPKGNLMRFTEVLMTDRDTADLFKNFELPVNKVFPNLTINAKVDTLTYMPTEIALRASISDPFLVNPAMYGEYFYFTGAADLYPIDIANYLADEVVATYPISLFKDYENLAIKSTYGETQANRVLYAIQDERIRWIDQSIPPKNISFDPEPNFLMLQNNIPTDPAVFASKIQQQFDFGYARTKEALAIKSNKGPFTNHLREPINPKLFKSFTCANANVWKTDQRQLCYVDTTSGCNRATADSCTPIR